MSTTIVEFEDDDTPSVGPQRVQSAGWIPPPSTTSCRGPPSPLADSPDQDFSVLGMLEAQKGAQLVHQLSLVTVLYNIMKTSNSFDISTIAQNGIEKMVVEFQREGSRWTFLMQAAYWNNESVTRWLFTHGADPNVRNASNQTALDVAMNERKMLVAEIIRIRMTELELMKKTAATPRSNPIDIIKAQQSR
jgi:hypothetical protein